MFLDGNKQVVHLVANKEMMRYGQGVISVFIEKIGNYFTELTHYYETDDMTSIKNWISENFID